VLREVRARVRALVRELDAHDGYTAGHSSAVVGWACAMGERLHLSLAELLEQLPGLEPVATIVRFHHERWDGSGYPDGLGRDRIPVASRIVAVCDAYQAMTSDRPYRVALPPAAAAHEQRAGAGTQFDPALVDCFVQVLQERGWPLGARMAAQPPGRAGTARSRGGLMSYILGHSAAEPGWYVINVGGECDMNAAPSLSVDRDRDPAGGPRAAAAVRREPRGGVHRACGGEGARDGGVEPVAGVP
jgi:HD domain